MPELRSRRSRIHELEQGIAKMEARRAVFGDTVTDLALAPLRSQLTELLSEQSISVVDHIEQLEGSGLIKIATIKPELEYLFRHALVQDVAYESMLKQDRREMHRRVAGALESAYPQRRDLLAAELAHHYTEAEDWALALEYWGYAADTALARYANPEAEMYYRSALSLAQTDRAPFLDGLGEALVRQGKHEEAITVWREAIDLFRAAGDLDRAALLYARSGRAAFHEGDNNRNLAIALEGLDALYDAPPSAGIAALLHEAARAYLFVGQQDKGFPYALRALEMAEQTHSREMIAHALTTKGAFVSLSPDERRALLQQAIDLAESEGYLDAASRAHFNMGTLLLYTLNDPQEALPHRYRAAELLRMMGATAQYARQLMSALNVSLTMGDTSTVRSGIGALSYAVRETHLPRGMLEGFEASVLSQEGHLDEACRIAEMLLTTGGFDGNVDTLGSIVRVLYLAYIELDRCDDAERWLPTLLEATKPFSTKALLRLLEARLRICQNRIDQAEELLKEAEHLFAERPNPFDGMLLRLESARLSAAKQDCDTALSMFETLASADLAHYRAEYAYVLRQMADVHLKRGADGDRSRGMLLLRKARDVYIAMPADGWVARIDEQLAALRVTTK